MQRVSRSHIFHIPSASHLVELVAALLRGAHCNPGVPLAVIILAVGLVLAPLHVLLLLAWTLLAAAVARGIERFYSGYSARRRVSSGD